MSSGVDRYRTALRGFGETVRRARPDRWDRPSPCPGWTARDVLDHVIGAQGALLGMLGDDRPLPAPTDPVLAWAAVEDRVLAAIAAPDLPQRRIGTPAGDLDGDHLLDMGVVEPLVHGWDLARAVGEDAVLDEDLAARCLEIARQYEPALRAPGMYGPARPAPDGPGAGPALLGYLGRDPG
jgi:uncharacterized protein (TIGR03086 family)